MQIIKHPSPNRTIGRQNQIPDFIVCHITGGSFTSAINTITNPASQVSYHYVVSPYGKIAQSVEITDTAWANGTTNSGDNRDNKHSTIPQVRTRRRNANQYTISIGFADSVRGELTPAQLAAGIELIWHIRNQVQSIYGLAIPMARTNIIGHHEITPITRWFCPGPLFPFEEIVQHDAPALEPSQENPSPWAKEAWDWGITNGLTDGTHPHSTPTREQMVTLLHRYHNTLKSCH